MTLVEHKRIIKHLVKIKDEFGYENDSKNLSAFFLKNFVNAESNQEIKESIIDEKGDNGIDFIFYDKKLNKIIIGQTKFSKKYKPNNSIKPVDITKFKTGITDFIDGNFIRFNPKFHNRLKDLQEKNENLYPDISIVILSNSNISSDLYNSNYRELLDFFSENIEGTNEDESEIQIINHQKIYSKLIYLHQSKKINEVIEISGFKKIQDPYLSYYGSIQAIKLQKLWNKFNNDLFDKNIRNALGDKKQNNKMKSTLKDSPTEFWYFNNGITIICDKLNAPRKVNASDIALKLENMSVVNGAQTISTIGDIKNLSPEANVLIRVISMQEVTDKSRLALNITKYNNSQNSLEKFYFLSLKEQQQKFSTEFLLDGYKYNTKTDKESEGIPNVINIKEAIRALSCKDLSIFIKIWRNIGLIVDDKSLYENVFPENLTTQDILLAVKKYRKTEQLLANTVTDYSRKFRFIVKPLVLYKTEKLNSEELITKEVISNIIQKIQSYFLREGIGNQIIYRSSKLKELGDAIFSTEKSPKPQLPLF